MLPQTFTNHYKITKDEFLAIKSAPATGLIANKTQGTETVWFTREMTEKEIFILKSLKLELQRLCLEAMRAGRDTETTAAMAAGFSEAMTKFLASAPQYHYFFYTLLKWTHGKIQEEEEHKKLYRRNTPIEKLFLTT